MPPPSSALHFSHPLLPRPRPRPATQPQCLLRARFQYHTRAPPQCQTLNPNPNPNRRQHNPRPQTPQSSSSATRPRPRFPHTTRTFTTTPRSHAEHATNPTHYQILSLEPTATAPEIKRQFFTLSKLHHPDKNPSDPDASKRFVKISEAYHVLSSPEKRSQYDYSIGIGSGGKSTGHRSGSYSSAQQRWDGGGGGSGAGGKPATGLNKKRGTFRGPPPSFYKSGGYGASSAKRNEYAQYTHHHHTHHTHPHPHSHSHSHSHPAGSAGGSSGGGVGGGFGPGATTQDYDSDVPHFDHSRHRRQHESVNEFIWRRSRRKRETGGYDAEEAMKVEADHMGPITRFLLVGGAVGIIGAIVTWFGEKGGVRHGSGAGKGKRSGGGG